MLNKVSSAVFDPRNWIIVAPVIILNMAAQAADLVGLIEANFKFMSYLTTLAYFFAVAIHARHPEEGKP